MRLKRENIEKNKQDFISFSIGKIIIILRYVLLYHVLRGDRAYFRVEAKPKRRDIR